VEIAPAIAFTPDSRAQIDSTLRFACPACDAEESSSLPFVIPSAAEGSAVPRTIPGNVFSTERTRISCHAPLAKRHKVPQEIRGTGVGLAVKYSEFGGGEREPCLQHINGATHSDHREHAQYLRA